MCCKLHFMLLPYITEQMRCHITNVSHSACILYTCKDLTLMNICTKTQPTATSTSYVIAINVPEKNPVTLLHMYVIY